MNLSEPIRSAEIDTGRTNLWTQAGCRGEKGEGGMNCECNIDIYTLPRVKQIGRQWEAAV